MPTINAISSTVEIITFFAVFVIMLIFAYDVRNPERHISRFDETGKHHGIGWFPAVIISLGVAIVSAPIASSITKTVLNFGHSKLKKN